MVWVVVRARSKTDKELRFCYVAVDRDLKDYTDLKVGDFQAIIRNPVGGMGGEAIFNTGGPAKFLSVMVTGFNPSKWQGTVQVGDRLFPFKDVDAYHAVRCDL